MTALIAMEMRTDILNAAPKPVHTYYIVTILEYKTYLLIMTSEELIVVVDVNKLVESAVANVASINNFLLSWWRYTF